MQASLVSHCFRYFELEDLEITASQTAIKNMFCVVIQQVEKWENSEKRKKLNFETVYAIVNFRGIKSPGNIYFWIT